MAAKVAVSYQGSALNYFRLLCKNCGWPRSSKCSFAALPLIVVRSIYIGRLVQSLAAPFVMCMRTLPRGVACVL